MDKVSKPLVTVATVVYNNVDALEKTLKNVLSQKYALLEYIVIDGGSNDGTLKLLEKYNGTIKWVSEPDNGIYDAMNKAVNLANGQWIQFLNAGDIFYNDEVINTVFSHEYDGIDLIYGDNINAYLDMKKEYYRKPAKLNSLWKHMIFDHQALFTRRTVLLKFPFDLSLKLASDFGFIYKCYISGHKFYYFNIPIAIRSYGCSGKSENDRKRSMMERRSVVLKSDSSLKVIIYYQIEMVKVYLKIIGRKMLPFKVQQMILSVKYTIINKLLRSTKGIGR